MSRNGSGTYNLPAGNPVVTGTTISSSWANTTMNDIANAITGSIAADGQTPITANLNLNNNKLINVADPANNQDAATKAYVDASGAAYLAKSSNLSDVANATTARTNLSAAKSGANSDITSITGLTTALAVNQGGTGTTTPSLVAGTGISISGSFPNQTITNTVSAGQGGRGQVFTSNGTFTIPTGITAIKVTVVGGGGGGGGGWYTLAGSVGAGSGGGGGGYAIQFFTGLTSGNTLSVTVGGGGAAGGGGGNGGTGGTSSVASGTQTITTVSATGGGAGQLGQNLAGSATTGGIGSGGAINGTGFYGYALVYGIAWSFGGSCSYGSGSLNVSANTAGVAGRAFGGGGSGGNAQSENLQYGGGAGGAGVVFIEW